MQPQSALLKKKITLEDFQIKRIIGKGSYGDVFLVMRNSQPYAMKEIIKRKLHRQKKQYQAMVEKQLLRCMKHPGIIKLKYAFQDKNKLYFVMEYCELGEFIRFMKQHVENFTEEVRRFYVAEIVNLLEYLHSNGITHRDLKPQNLLLGRDGHLKLVDFGTSEISQCKILSEEFKEQIEKQKDKEKQISSQQDFPQQAPIQQELMSPRKRRSTFVGTSYYISPQLLQQNICEPPSDLWALGCIIYQLYYLETPFKDTTEYGVFEKIKKVQLEFPKNHFISQQALDLIKKLLIKNPDERLGSCFREDLDYKHLKAHPYFKGINVDKVFSTIPPDINAKRFPFESQQTYQIRKTEFEDLAKKVLAQNEKSTKSSETGQEQAQIVIEGMLQKRQFPYYEVCYMRIYNNNIINLVKMERPENFESYEILTKKPEEKYEAARLVEKTNTKFVVEMKDRSKEVFKCQDANKWVNSINSRK